VSPEQAVDTIWDLILSRDYPVWDAAPGIFPLSTEDWEKLSPASLSFFCGRSLFDIPKIKGNMPLVFIMASTPTMPRGLAEFCYRFNHRFGEPQMFNRILYAGLNSGAITFSELRI
jgi:hypothetical protein